MEVAIPFLLLAGLTMALMFGVKKRVRWRRGEYILAILPLIEEQILAFTPLNESKSLSNYFIEGLSAGIVYLLVVIVRILVARERLTSVAFTWEVVSFAVLILVVFIFVTGLPE